MKLGVGEQTSNGFMRVSCFVVCYVARFMVCFWMLAACAFAAPPAQLLPKAPVRFEPNQGQFGRAVLWSARGPGYSVGFTRDATLLHVGERTVAMRLAGQDLTAPFEAENPFSVPANYITPGFQGSVRTYGRLHRRQVYPGVDLVYYGSGDNLEYDFELAAGADPARIHLRFAGMDELTVAPNGDLLVRAGGRTVTHHAPVVYQRRASGEQTLVPASYRIGAQQDVTIAVASFDAAAPLVIDPVISFATYLFGSGADVGLAIGRDQYGFIYVAGNTSSLDYPNTNAAVDANRGGQDAFVMKLDPTAATCTQVVCYSTFYGGGGVDALKAMAVDPTGLIYLAGTTNSTDLITTNAYKSAPAVAASTGTTGTDAFVVFLDPSRSGSLTLVYATYLGGTQFDEATAITYFAGKIYVAGSTSSDDFPVVNAYQPVKAPGRDMWVAEIDPNQSGAATLAVSTFFGGSSADYARTLLVDAPGHVYVAGETFSADFPLSPNAYQTVYAGGGDGFLTEFNLDRASGGYSTFLGGAGLDDIRKIVKDGAGRIGMAGYTSSSNFPITQNAYQPLLGGSGAINAFLAVLDPTAGANRGLTYSTFYGGSSTEAAWDMRIDAQGNYYLVGYSFSPDLPVSQNALNPISAQGGLNGFVAVLNPAAPPLNALTYGSYITGVGSQAAYGVEVDASGGIYVTGYATSDIFPAGYQPHVTPGNSDTFVLIFTP